MSCRPTRISIPIEQMLGSKLTIYEPQTNHLISWQLICLAYSIDVPKCCADLFPLLVSMLDLLLLIIHCQLQIICIYIQQHGGVEGIDVQTTRVIAHLLAGLGQVLDNVEACVQHDARRAATGDNKHVAYVMSFYYNIREVVDDLIV